MKKGTSINSHITGEKNNGNVSGDAFSVDRKGNINLNKTEISTHTFLFAITLLVLLVGELIFGSYLLNELKIAKEELKIYKETLETKINADIERQENLINQFIYTYGGN